MTAADRYVNMDNQDRQARDELTFRVAEGICRSECGDDIWASDDEYLGEHARAAHHDAAVGAVAAVIANVETVIRAAGGEVRTERDESMVGAHYSASTATTPARSWTTGSVRERRVAEWPWEKAATDERPVCEAFAWIGQPWTSCDHCGHPFWEHTHERGVGSQAGMPMPIPPERAEAMRERWGGGNR